MPAAYPCLGATGKQLTIRLDLISSERTSPLVATSDFRGQCPEGAARTWIPAVHTAHIVDFIIARDGRIAAMYLFFDKLP